MKEKKNIERLFQEKLKHLEATPPPGAWENISNALHPEEKKRKIIPFWIKASGIAATLLLGIFFAKELFIPKDSIELTDNNKPETPHINSGKDLNSNSVHHETNTNNQSGTNEQTSDWSKNSSIQLVESSQPIKEETEQASNYKTDDNSNQTAKNKSSSIVINETQKKETNNYQKESNNENLIDGKKDDSTEVALQTKNTELNKNHTKDITQKDFVIQPEQELLATSETVEQELEELNKIGEKETEENIEEQVSFNKWKITPTIAPITMNSITDGSPISDNFIENSKKNVTTLSYGMGFSYALNSKVNIRAGINKVSVGYNTENVEIYASANTKDILSNIVNINFNETSENIVVRPVNAFTSQSEFTPTKGKINQQFGYIEVPVELSYKLLDRRFEIELIGGMSTLFLNENEVSVISNGMSTLLGEADNLNEVHFSTNLGVGFRYRIFQSFEASLEPMFKYQLGTFSKNDGNFKPYILGLYTGLSFKF